MIIKFPDYSNSIMNVSNSILKYYGVKTKYNGIDVLDEKLKNDYNHIIYILLDGMGTNVVKKLLKKTDGLRRYMRKEITSVFPPTTVAATDAVISGVPPITNGHLGWVQYFPNEDVNMVVFQQRDFYDEDNIIEEDLREKYLSFKRMYQQISEVNKDVNASEIFPSFLEGGAESFAEQVERVLTKVKNNDKSFTYIYWTQPDLYQHQFGVYSDEVKDVLEELNVSFEDLINNIDDDTLVVVIADHGLTDVQPLNLFEYTDILSSLKRLPSLEPRATNFFVKEEKLDSFREMFNRYFENEYLLYSKQEVLDMKLFGDGIQHKMIDSFLGDFIAIAIDKYMFVLNEGKSYKAHHAGLLEDEMMVPLIIYSKK
ncbi:MAG: Type I phosphodiesterase / nucleotide pyrophosphatase [Candidatus Izimaplasma bacterium HR2]|nr:MAG: Type I phosphodiesterase / nucleotide pyrophosphatase [Candidatus Izimaplasma bacterium HR2]